MLASVVGAAGFERQQRPDRDLADPERGPGGGVEQFAVLGRGRERGALLDPDRVQEAAQVEIGGVDRFVLDVAVEHVEVRAVAREEHVARHTRRVREAHRGRVRRLAERVDDRPLDRRDRLAEVTRVAKERPPEQEHVASPRPIDETLGWFGAVVVGAEQHVGGALAVVGGHADVALPQVLASM